MVQNNPQKVNFDEIFDALYAIPKIEIDPLKLPTLARISERDAVWDNHRASTQDVAQIYAYSDEFKRFAERMGACSGWLHFGYADDGLKLKSASFCRVRNCPVCQWRKSLYWKAMMYKTYDDLKAEYPKYRWLFLTLTLQNPHVSDLRPTLELMHKAWRKLVKRKEFALVDGWIRTTEVTRDTDRPNTHVHPHYHAILLVKPSYFKGQAYVKQMDWVRIWGECLGVDYLPNVDIRIVKPKNGDDSCLRGVIAETLKYAVKPSEMLGDGSYEAQEWFLEYSRQVHKLRFVASGGVLKNALKPQDDITYQEMIAPDGEQDQSEQTDNRRLNFTYYPTHRRYIYNPEYNQ